MQKKLALGILAALSLAVNVSAQETLENLKAQAQAEADAKNEQDMHAQAEVIRQQLLAQGPYFALRGTLKSDGNNAYSVNGESFEMDDNTRVHGDLRDGAEVAISGAVVDGKRVAKIVSIGNEQSSNSAPGPAQDMAPMPGMVPQPLQPQKK